MDTILNLCSFMLSNKSGEGNGTITLESNNGLDSRLMKNIRDIKPLKFCQGNTHTRNIESSRKTVMKLYSSKQSVHVEYLKGYDIRKMTTQLTVDDVQMQTTEAYNWSVIIENDVKLGALKLFKDSPEELMKFSAAILVLFMIIGIPGNLITVIALVRHKEIRNASTIFIINLSLCDLVYCCFNLPLAASSFWTRTWPHGLFMCRLFPLTRFALAGVSVFTIFGITINRYIMISHYQLYHKLYTSKKLAVIIAIIWILPILALIPTWFEKWGRFGMDTNISYCSILPDSANKSPVQVYFLCAFVIPFLTIMVCYARIYYIVKKTTKNSQAGRRRYKLDNLSVGTSNSFETAPNSTKPESEMTQHHEDQPLQSEICSVTVSSIPKSSASNIVRTNYLSLLPLKRLHSPVILTSTSKDKRLLRIIIVITLTFFICYLPITIVNIFCILAHCPVIFQLSYILRYLTTCINPIIYVMMSKEYRKAYKKLFTSFSCGNILSYCRK